MSPPVRAKNTVEVGDEFGYLTVLQANYGSRVSVACKCRCGNIKPIRIFNLCNGTVKSCGCFRRTVIWSGDKLRKHGMTQTPEYQCWLGIIKRCYNTNHDSYLKYGARGITMSQEWRQSFEVFFAYVGPRPDPKYSLDRWPNKDGNYEPGNVRWATKRQQRENQVETRIHPLTALGKTMLLLDWERETGLTRSAIKKRLARGFTPDEAVSTPPMSSKEAAKRATFARTGIQL